MKNKLKILLSVTFFVFLLSIGVHASTSSEVYNNSYMKMYSSKYPDLNPSYQKDEGEGYVDATHGSLSTYTEDYRIKGKNGFDVPFIRSYSSHTSGGEIYYKNYNSKTDAPDCYYTRYICSEDNSRVLIYFKNEKEAFEAWSGFEGIMYDENDENMYDYLTSGSGTITYTRDEEYGLQISEYDTYSPVRYIRAFDEDSFVPFDNTMQILKPSIFCYDYLIDGDYVYVNIIFQDLNGKACILDLEYDRDGSPNKFDGCEKGKYTAYSEYEMSAVDNDDISVEATHPAGFSYNMTLVSDSGVTYYVMRNTYQIYEVLGVSDRYGNTYVFNMTDTSYSVTTPEGDVYVCSVNGITKNSNGEVTQLVSYDNEVINSEDDINNEFEIDDEYIFTITKNSGTSLNISANEKNVTKYYFKKELLYEELADTPWLPAYSLVYKIELPTGLTKYSEYTEQKNWYMGLPGDKLRGNYFFVSRYYETNGTSVKNEVEYSYSSKNTPTNRTGENHYIYESTQRVMVNGSATKSIHETYDYMSRLTEREVDAVSNQDNTYEYEYTGSKPDSKVSKILIEEYRSGVIAYHEKSYTYSGNHLKSETDGEYNINYTYGSNYIPTEIIYQKDATTTVKTANILTEDGKSIAQQNVYENDTLVKTTNYTYDSYGNILSESVIVDNNSVVTNYAYNYNEGGGYTLVTTRTGLKDADGQALPNIVTTTVFDYNYNPVSYTDAKGYVTTTEYDNIGRPVRISYPDNTVETYSYDMSNNVTTYTAKNGTVYKAYFDKWGKLIKNTAIDNGSEITLEKYSYGTTGNMLSYIKYYTNNKYVKASYGYDCHKRIVSEKIYDSGTLVKTTTYTHKLEEDEDERPVATVTVKITSEDSAYASYKISSNYRGYITEKKHFTDTAERTYTYTNDYVGNVLTETDPAGNVTNTVYNAFNMPTQITYADGSTTSYTYNPLGWLTSQTDGRGNITEYEYDNAGRVITTYTPFDTTGNAFTKTYYDANGNVTEKAVARYINGAAYDRTIYGYDVMNRPTYSAVYEDQTSAIYTCYEYDSMGNPTTVTAGKSSLTDTTNGQALIYAYDTLGRLITLTTPDGKTQDYTYDRQGRQLTATDKSGIITSYTYDVFDNITSKQAGNEEVSYTYNLNSQRTSMTDSTGTTNYTYNVFGELTQEAKGDIIKTYTYDSRSNRTGFSVTNAGTSLFSHTYTYDSMSRLLSASDGTDTVSYTYDQNSNLLTTSLNGNLHQQTTYNKANMPTRADYYNPSNVNTDFIIYEYYLDGNMKSKIHNDTQGTSDSNAVYDYDLSGELMYEETYSGVSGYRDYYYYYDNYGNRTIKGCWSYDDSGDTKETQYSYNNINQLTSDTEGNTYTYDDNGNLTSVIQNGETVKSYTYDSFNRLIQSTVNGVTTQYTYDGDNLRQTKTVNGVQTKHIYDGMNIVADIGAETKVYFRGNDLVKQKNKTTNTSQTYYTGHRGDVFKVANTDGTYKGYRYLSYGDTFTTGADVSNPFGYCGEYTDSETGLVYLRNRYYDPTLGVFTTEDPARDGLNWYAYCNGNPIMFVDPLGLDVYYFVNSEFIKEAEKDQKKLNKYYNEPVHVLETDSRSSFIEEWNKMGSWDGEDVDVSLVVFNMHGSPGILQMKSGENIYTIDITNETLIPKNIDNILVLGCNSGHFDYRYSSLVNKMLIHNNVDSVIASDGTVSTRSLFGNYKSMDDDTFVELSWKKEKRDNFGFIKYTQNDKGELEWEKLGKKFNITSILEKAGVK